MNNLKTLYYLTHDEREIQCVAMENQVTTNQNSATIFKQPQVHECRGFKYSSIFIGLRFNLMTNVMLSKPRQTRCLDSADKTKTRVIQQ